MLLHVSDNFIQRRLRLYEHSGVVRYEQRLSRLAAGRAISSNVDKEKNFEEIRSSKHALAVLNLQERSITLS